MTQKKIVQLDLMAKMKFVRKKIKKMVPVDKGDKVKFIGIIKLPDGSVFRDTTPGMKIGSIYTVKTVKYFNIGSTAPDAISNAICILVERMPSYFISRAYFHKVNSKRR